MNLKNIDLEEELQKLNQKETHSIEELKQALHDAFLADVAIENRISGVSISNEVDATEFDPLRLYSKDQIKQICLKYRLRFLDASLFKGEIPREAIAKIKQIEKTLGRTVHNFKIIAPKEMFRLKDKDSDPILFLKINDNCFYLIHKWGGEMNRFRRILAFPLQSFSHLFWVIIALSLIVAAIVPTPRFGYTLFMFVHAFIALSALSCIYVFGHRQNFSTIEWDSKYIA